MIVNGEKLSIDTITGNSLISLLEYYKLSPGRVAIEINGNVIKKIDYNQTIINENDVIEIIHFVGGGV
ncbi:MAG: sulfur carrier protein ThiS [Spirochaetia bacterium]|nr:sulfur carrier protein ThiS [Spirochaetia bacterium]